MKKIYLKESPGKGMGVFAGEDIKKDELIEKCYLIRSDMERTDVMYDYAFKYPHTGDFKHLVLPTGFGMIYNHDDNSNAIWFDAKEAMHFDWFAKKDIKKEKEIFTDYGAGYWVEMNERNPELKKITNDQ